MFFLALKFCRIEFGPRLFVKANSPLELPSYGLSSIEPVHQPV
jgi:hypothetical protein